MKIRPSNEEDLKKIRHWFQTAAEAKKWGGISIHFPIEFKQLKEDIDWDTAMSYSLVDEKSSLVGFCQVFHKFGYKHLSRIAINPEMRGRKISYNLINLLQQKTAEDSIGFSLFVYKNNIPAKRLYENLGFIIHPHPQGLQEIEDCVFMVKED